MQNISIADLDSIYMSVIGRNVPIYRLIWPFFIFWQIIRKRERKERKGRRIVASFSRQNFHRKILVERRIEERGSKVGASDLDSPSQRSRGAKPEHRKFSFPRAARSKQERVFVSRLFF